MRLIIYVAFGLLGFVPLGPAASFFIAPEGKDSNPGTISKPFASLEKARGTEGFWPLSERRSGH